MSTAVDLYATTNPAFGCALMWSFLAGVAEGRVDASRGETSDLGLEFPLLFLPLPILLSSLRDTMAHTNRRTGFYAWLERHPELRVGLADRVERMTPTTRRAVLYGARAQLITAASDGRFHAAGGLSHQSLARAGDTVRPLFPLARRLGIWVGEVRAARDILYALGLRV